MRRIFVGDIQGCRAQLEALLEAVGFDAARDVLHPVGDLVNKGPDSTGVLRVLMACGAAPVLGNHDLEWLDQRRCEDPAQDAWLRAQPVVRVMPDVILVHAGLHPAWRDADLADLSDPRDIDFAVNVRYCDAAGNRPASDWPPPPPPFVPWHHHYRGARRVVFGHWARQGLLRTDRLVGLDTGCVYGKQLSAWIAEEDRIVQVPGWQGATR